MVAPVLDDVSLSDLISLRGRRALVTGGSRGIGLACAVRLAEAGADVMIGDRDPDEAQIKQAVGRLGNSQGTVAVARLDVTDPADVDAVLARTVGELGGLDILVNNAGIFPAASVLDQDFETWQRVIAVTLDGTPHCSRAVAAHMTAAGGGVIINVTSTNGHRGAGPGLSAYTSSKHALTGVTKARAIDLGPRGIRVLAVAPTTSDTPGSRGSSRNWRPPAWATSSARSGRACRSVVSVDPMTPPGPWRSRRAIWPRS